MNLLHMFEFAVSRHPNCEAIVEGEQRLNYHAFDEQITRIAAGLQSVGVAKGDRVVIVLKNRLEMVALYWAVVKIGAVFTPINFRLSTEEVKYCIQNSEAKAVVYEPVSEKVVLEAVSEFKRPIMLSVLGASGADETYENFLVGNSGVFKQVNVSDEDICLMLYTSGTTGKPKGVPRSHKNEYSAATAHIIQNRYEMKESTIGVMPLYHTMGMRSLLSMAFLNGKLIMMPDFEPVKALQVLEREKVTCIYLVPTLIHDILHHPDFERTKLDSLKKVGYAGAAMTTALTEEVFRKLKPEVFVNHYGSTEVYTFSICNYLDKKPACAGKPGYHQQLRLVVPDAEGNSTSDDRVPFGEPGEIIVNIASIEAFKGYWNRPDSDRKAIRNGWYFTGDMGALDQDGDLYVMGRVDDMIISGGENIHPLEVEDILAKHPRVAEVAVVGIPDERWGEIVTAFVVPKDGRLTTDELDRFCLQNTQLANFKRPRKYVWVSQIPKSPVGKLLRRKLRNGEYEPLDHFKEDIS